MCSIAGGFLCKNSAMFCEFSVQQLIRITSFIEVCFYSVLYFLLPFYARLRVDDKHNVLFVHSICALRLRSMLTAWCMMAPTEIKSTPVRAYAVIFSRLIPPDASVSYLPPISVIASSSCSGV